jgi:hypothetical protein
VVRLNTERDNLRRWLCEEQRVVHRAIELCSSAPSTSSFLFCILTFN